MVLLRSFCLSQSALILLNTRAFFWERVRHTVAAIYNRGKKIHTLITQALCTKFLLALLIEFMYVNKVEICQKRHLVSLGHLALKLKAVKSWRMILSSGSQTPASFEWLNLG